MNCPVFMQMLTKTTVLFFVFQRQDQRDPDKLDRTAALAENGHSDHRADERFHRDQDRRLAGLHALQPPSVQKVRQYRAANADSDAQQRQTRFS